MSNHHLFGNLSFLHTYIHHFYRISHRSLSTNANEFSELEYEQLVDEKLESLADYLETLPDLIGGEESWAEFDIVNSQAC